nr:hypothetical protein 69 [Pelagibacteraceae bacterium]
MQWLNNLKRYAGDVFSAGFDGVDAAAGNTISDPNLKTVSEGIRDFSIEALPGPQKTNLDVNFGEGSIKTAGYLNSQGLLKSGVKNRVQQRVGKLRETVAEKTLGAGARKALGIIGKKAAANAGRAFAGSMASGGLASGPLSVWALADTIDTGLQVATGKGVMDYADKPGENSFEKTGYYRGALADKNTVDERPLGTESILGGKKVIWGGNDYGWQSPESYATIDQTAAAPEPAVMDTSMPEMSATDIQERPFGSESTLGGEPVFWGGDDYGWQSREAFNTIRR